MQNTFDLKAGKLFPWHFQLVGGLLLIGGLIALSQLSILTPILLLLSGWMLTSYCGTEFNQSNNTYREYNSYFFIKTGKWQTYNGVTKIFINSKNMSQRMYTPRTTQSSEFKSKEYNAYLKLTSGGKIHLLALADKNEVLKRSEKLANFLGTNVQDNTGHQ
ncbi:MAG: hypothetical protein JXQ96_01955 [Cyclobacteriaceae bacterium]